MNLRLLQLNEEKITVDVLLSGHITMAGINKKAVQMKNDIEKYINKYINAHKKYFYRDLSNELYRILNTDDFITYNNVEIHNHIVYIRWKYKTSDQMLCITCNLKFLHGLKG